MGLLAAVMQYTAVRIVVVKLPCKVKKNYASAETETKYMLYFHAGYLIEHVISLNYPIYQDMAPRNLYPLFPILDMHSDNLWNSCE